VSELSDSGHLRTTNPEHAVALLKRAKLPGDVFPEHNGWVTFVFPPGDENRFDLEQANERLLVLYEYAGAYGCWVTVYQGKKPVTRLRAAFDRPNSLFDRKPFEALELLSPPSAAAVDAWVKRAHVPHERSRAPYLIAERLHLPRYAWLSYLAEQTREAPDARRIQVLANGTVKRPPKPPAPHVATVTATKTNRAAKKEAATKTNVVTKPKTKPKTTAATKRKPATKKKAGKAKARR
jgi:hypothetical protein